MPDPLLELRHLQKRFGGLTVTDDVSLTVHPGEIHAVIGPNGAGKTTLIHQIGGTIRPDAGTIHIMGQDVTTWSMPRRARAGLGRSFQLTCIIPGFTALENTALAVQATGARNLHPPAMAALHRVNLSHRAGVIAATLSHGEKRQLELAVALAAKPRLLLLDEPLAGAGPEETERLITLLASLRSDPLRQDHGILLVEHDMQAVFALADRISVLVYGRLIVTGPPEAIKAHPEVRTAYLGEDEPA